MSLNLSRLKKWLTLEDAAKHLSLLLSEEVTTSDLLQLAIHGELILSVTMPGSYWAYPYTASAPKKVSHTGKQLQKRDSPMYTAALLAQVEYAGLRVPAKDETSGKLGPDFLDGRTISGTWDLTMLGAERELVTELAGSSQNSSAAFAGEKGLENNRPIILNPPNDADLLVGLFDNGDENRLEDMLEQIDKPDDTELAEGLFLIGFDARKAQQFPTGSFFVIRTENLQKLTTQLNERPTTHHAGTTTASGMLAGELEALPDDIRALYEALQAEELPHLDLLITAWRKFWKGRRLNDGKDYPINAEVADWVKNQMEKPEQGNSKAKAIASIIRPTWAPTGRQPNRNQ